MQCKYKSSQETRICLNDFTSSKYPTFDGFAHHTNLFNYENNNRFIGIRAMGRDENMMQYVLRVLMQVLVNFSMGLVMALVLFIFSLWSIVRDYQANPIVAVFFFLAASCAAFAFVASYLLAMFGATAGGLYGLAKIAESNQRAINDGRQRPHCVNQRPHRD
jgi:uncharacterized membrane protein YqjE